MGHDFEDIEVKRNAPEMLERQLRRKRTPCMIATGSMCDPYIHLEEELRVTRRCLETIERHGFGLAILTKSARILRDLDLLTAINEKARCVVQVSLSTYDEDLCGKVEPNVSATKERVRVLEVMRDAGIPTVVWLCPTLPFINDTEENLRCLLECCIGADVRGIVCFGFGMTLREGSREHYYGELDRLFPGLKDRYIRTYGDEYVCNSPNSPALTEIFERTCREHGIISTPEEVFAYMREFPSKRRQTTFDAFM
jgi:DNA repair photolyase